MIHRAVFEPQPVACAAPQQRSAALFLGSGHLRAGSNSPAPKVQPLPGGSFVERPGFGCREDVASEPALVEIRGPDGALGMLVVEEKDRVEPKDVAKIADRLSLLGRSGDGEAAVLVSHIVV